MGWNGLDLLNDFSAELGDVSNGFKTRVLRWINEGIRDISTAHAWPFLRERGQAVFEEDIETHSIVLAKPAAPTAAALAGGSLVDGTIVRALVTFYEGASQVESIAGEISNTITPTGANLSVRLSALPVSTCPLVTERRIYVSIGASAFQYHGKVSNNLVEIPGTPDPEVDPPTPITYDITAAPSSQVTPPDEDAIFKIDGDLMIEGQRVLQGSSIQNIKFLSSATPATGTPELWAPVNEEEVLVHPKPSEDTTVTFYYFKRPARIFGTVDSVPQLPSWLYEDLRRYVIWRGFEFRDRAGKESKQINYDNGLKQTISRKGKPLKKSGRIRSVTPDSDGWVS
jgi:hypothetical protein